MHMPDCHEGSLYFYLCKRQSLPKLRQFRSIVVELASSHTAQLLTRGIHRHGHRVSLFWSVLRRQYSFCCGHGIQSQSRPQQHHACPSHAAHPNRTWPPHCSGVYARSTSIHMVALHGDHKDLIHCLCELVHEFTCCFCFWGCAKQAQVLQIAQIWPRRRG